MGRKHRIDGWLASAVIGLLALGSVVIYAIGPRVAQFQNSQEGTLFSDDFYFRNHSIFVIASILVMALMAMDWRPLLSRLSRIFLKRDVEWKFNFDLLARFANVLLIVSALLCYAIPILGKLHAPFVTCDLGACRSFRIPGLGIGFQAVELFKIAVILYLSTAIARRREKGLMSGMEFWAPIALVAFVTLTAVCWLQSDLGSTVVILFMIFCMVLISGVSAKQIAALLAVLLLVAVFAVLLSPYRVKRLMGWQGEGDQYHLDNSLIGIGTGGLTGVGIGNSIQSTGYLPESVSDSIFAIICEVFGFVGGFLVMFLYAFILFRLIRIAKHTRPFAQRLAVVAIFAWILAHVIINVSGMTGLLPMKGITLLFLSYGGTSLLFSSAAVGLALQISTWTEREEINEDTSSGRGQRRTRNASYSRRS